MGLNQLNNNLNKKPINDILSVFDEDTKKEESEFKIKTEIQQQELAKELYFYFKTDISVSAVERYLHNDITNIPIDKMTIDDYRNMEIWQNKMQGRLIGLKNNPILDYHVENILRVSKFIDMIKIKLEESFAKYFDEKTADEIVLFCEDYFGNQNKIPKEFLDLITAKNSNKIKGVDLAWKLFDILRKRNEVIK